MIKPYTLSIRYVFPVFCYCLLLFTATGCNNPGNDIPDVSKIKVDLKTFRFDKDFAEIDSNHISEGLQKLNEKYPDFLSYFLDTFETFGFHHDFSDGPGKFDSTVKPLIAFKDFVNLQKVIDQQYPDTKKIDKQLTDGFRLMKYYYPAFTVPRIIYMDMFLANWPAFSLDTGTVCVGLDWFLGDDFAPYASVGMPPYMLSHTRESYLPVAVFKAIYQANNLSVATEKNLLDLMIHYGKEQYFLHKIMPHAPDSVLFGFPQRKLDWCSKNESLIYNFFIHQGLLYDKTPQNIMPYVNEGPFAVNIPDSDPAHNTPGNIGTWLGYKIVCAYMAQNPGITLPQLLAQRSDAAQFLDAAKYRPK